MYLDVRTPAGSLFVVVGGLLMLYGALGDPSVYERSLGVNINVYWGATMIAFGAALLMWRRLSTAVVPEPAREDLEDDVGERPHTETRESHPTNRPKT